MSGPEPRRSTGATVVAVAALVAVVYIAASGHRDETTEPPSAVGWYGAMSMYRALALWAGKRALLAEANYWKAVT